MYGIYQRIVVKGADLEAIMQKLHDAERAIYDCYSELERLGVVEIVKDEGAAGGDRSPDDRRPMVGSHPGPPTSRRTSVEVQPPPGPRKD